MMHPKPERKIKEKKSYNSLQSKKKDRKPIAPWRENILSHHTDRPSKADRGEFPRKVVAELIEEAGGKCQSCRTNPDTTTHHVWPRGRVNPSPGRGVKTNGLRLCGTCHDRIQTNEEELQHWIEVYRKKYGDFFWFDELDWEEHNRKQAALKEAEEEQKQRMSELEPIVNLLSLAANRKLKAAEIRLIDGLDEKELSIFARMMNDIIGTNVRQNEVHGYGHFND